MPEGYAKIDARGRLSVQATKILGVVNLKKGRAVAKTKKELHSLIKKKDK